MSVEELACEGCGANVGEKVYRITSTHGASEKFPQGRPLKVCENCAYEMRQGRKRLYEKDGNLFSYPLPLWQRECECGRVLVFEATEAEAGHSHPEPKPIAPPNSIKGA